MNFPGRDIKFPKRTPGEERLMDYFWPCACAEGTPEYFRESIALLKTVVRREEEIIVRLGGYLEFAKDPEVRTEIEAFIHSLEEKLLAQAKKAEKKHARTKR
jgi:hypothetical protein